MNYCPSEILYSMELHEIVPIDTNSSVRRVPGGWVYGDCQGCVFVPYDNEFQIRKEETKSYGTRIAGDIKNEEGN